MSLTPRVSILIPNFNNGRASSRTGQRDFIRDLLESLDETLRQDPTPFEILAFDDGSTDDSIDTLRDWEANRTWPDGRPFLTLMEAPHCGVLAVTANKLSRAARGDILARLDGDIICLTPNWVSRLCAIFDAGPPSLGIIGPKQLNVLGQIHEFGDWLLHPKGYHHNAHGLPRDAVSGAMEVDDAMGCFYCCRKSVYDELGGYDESFLRGQTVDFGLRARLAGWRCWAVADIEYIHAHSERGNRQTAADSSGGLQKSIDRFEEKWGFSRLAPDLDHVRQRFAGTPLLWNPKWLAAQLSSTALRHEPDGADASLPTDWDRYRTDAALRLEIDLRMKVALDVITQAGPRRLVAHVGCGCGLIGHHLASRGVPYLGLDERPAMVRLARTKVEHETYPGEPPRFDVIEDRRHLPVKDGSADLVLLYDIVEHHPNPVGLFKESARLLEPGGIVLLISKRGKPGVELPHDIEHRYDFHQLATQMLVTGLFRAITSAKQDDPARDILLAMQRLPAP
ncbi:MAG: methyltransferase domain-containing protein [Phycisphaerales bacterium]|nr:methyltransferase domain-containing protein [Phycisphaerales bacterium]